MNLRNVKSGLVLILAASVTMLVGFRLGARAGIPKKSAAMPPASIPTFPTDNLARQGYFYVGGQYVGPQGKEVMHGAMYVEVWVPKQLRQPYPIVFFHGNGQTGTVWRQTPDGRPGP